MVTSSRVRAAAVRRVVRWICCLSVMMIYYVVGITTLMCRTTLFVGSGHQLRISWFGSVRILCTYVS